MNGTGAGEWVAKRSSAGLGEQRRAASESPSQNSPECHWPLQRRPLANRT